MLVGVNTRQVYPLESAATRCGVSVRPAANVHVMYLYAERPENRSSDVARRVSGWRQESPIDLQRRFATDFGDVLAVAGYEV